MKPDYFRFLADGGFANINISIESLDPAFTNACARAPATASSWKTGTH